MDGRLRCDWGRAREDGGAGAIVVGEERRAEAGAESESEKADALRIEVAEGDYGVEGANQIDRRLAEEFFDEDCAVLVEGLAPIELCDRCDESLGELGARTLAVEGEVDDHHAETSGNPARDREEIGGARGAAGVVSDNQQRGSRMPVLLTALRASREDAVYDVAPRNQLDLLRRRTMPASIEPEAAQIRTRRRFVVECARERLPLT